MSRQARKVGKYGPTKITSMSLPQGLLDIADQIGEVRATGATAHLPGEAITRSAVIADMMDLALDEINRRRRSAGLPAFSMGPAEQIPGQLSIEGDG